MKLRGKNTTSGVYKSIFSCHRSVGKEFKTKGLDPVRILLLLQSTGESLQSKTEWIHKFRSLLIKSLFPTWMTILMTISNPKFPRKGFIFKHHQRMKLEAQPPAWELWGTPLKHDRLPSCSCLPSTCSLNEDQSRSSDCAHGFIIPLL